MAELSSWDAGYARGRAGEDATDELARKSYYPRLWWRGWKAGSEDWFAERMKEFHHVD